MGLAKRRELQDLQRKVRELRPAQSYGVLTSRTTAGVVRKANPNIGRGKGGGGNEARWA